MNPPFFWVLILPRLRIRLIPAAKTDFSSKSLFYIQKRFCSCDSALRYPLSPVFFSPSSTLPVMFVKFSWGFLDLTEVRSGLIDFGVLIDGYGLVWMWIGWIWEGVVALFVSSDWGALLIAGAPRGWMAWRGEAIRS